MEDATEVGTDSRVIPLAFTLFGRNLENKQFTFIETRGGKLETGAGPDMTHATLLQLFRNTSATRAWHVRNMIGDCKVAALERCIITSYHRAGHDIFEVYILPEIV